MRYKSRKTRGDRARVSGKWPATTKREPDRQREMRRYKFSQRAPVKNSRTTNGIVNSLRKRKREREDAFIKIVPFDPSGHPQGTILPLPLLRSLLLSTLFLLYLLPFLRSFVKSVLFSLLFFHLSLE